LFLFDRLILLESQNSNVLCFVRVSIMV